MRYPILKRGIIYSIILGSVTFAGSVIHGQTYYVQSGDSLYSIAARYGTTISALQQKNGLTSATLYPGQALTISTQSSVPANTSTKYTVQAGDSLYLIAKRYGISVDTLKNANNLSSNYLTVGKQLMIPTVSRTSAGTGSYNTYSVQAGDSLYLIAQKYGISVDTLKQANGLSSNSVLTGQTLKIPSAGSASNISNAYTVKNGDTLYLIAQQNGISLSQLLSANNMSSSSQIYPGQRLTIPKSTGSGITWYQGHSLSSGDLDLLARLVSAESSGESFEGQVAVAATILHRLTDDRYPKTIPGIVYQIDNGRYQYSPVLDGRINLAATASATNAVKQAIAGWDPSNGGNGFYNPEKTTSQWVRSQTVTAVIGDHVFFTY